MNKIRLVYIIAEIILITSLLWAALNLSFFAEDFELISDLSRLISSFGIALVLVGGRNFRESHPHAVVYGILFFTVVFYNLEKIGFERYTETASGDVIESSFAKVMAMSLIPDGTPLSERLDFRVGIELMDNKTLSSKLNEYVGKGNMLDTVEKRITLDAGGYDFSDQVEFDPMYGVPENVMFKAVEEAYINSLYRSKELYQLADAYKSDGVSYEDYVLDYMRKLTISDDSETAGGLIWLWYTQTEGWANINRVHMLRAGIDYSDFRKKVILPEIHKSVKSTSVTLNTASFHKLGGSRYIGESAHMLWLVTTIGVLIAILSLLMNIVVLVREKRQSDL